LPIEFRHFTSAKGLCKCRESFEKVTEPWIQCQPILDPFVMCNCAV
jgi:hypothetical protein